MRIKHYAIVIFKSGRQGKVVHTLPATFVLLQGGFRGFLYGFIFLSSLMIFIHWLLLSIWV